MEIINVSCVEIPLFRVVLLNNKWIDWLLTLIPNVYFLTSVDDEFLLIHQLVGCILSRSNYTDSINVYFPNIYA